MLYKGAGWNSWLLSRLDALCHPTSFSTALWFNQTSTTQYSTHRLLIVVLGCFILGVIVSPLHPQWRASTLPTWAPASAHPPINMDTLVSGLQSTNNNKAATAGWCECFRYTSKGCLAVLLPVPVSSEDNKGLLCIYKCSGPLWARVFTYAAGWKEGRKAEGNHLCSRYINRKPFLESHPLTLLCSHTVSSCQTQWGCVNPER